MKHIILTLLLLLSFLSCKAQTVYNMNNLPESTPSHFFGGESYYIKDVENHFDDVVGTWKWESGNDSFEITLQKFEMINYPNFSTKYKDEIFGKYKSIENGVAVSEVDTIVAYPNFNLALNFQSPTEYSIIIKDVSTNKSLGGTFIINTDGTATITLDTTRPSGGGYYHPDNPPNPAPFSLPTSVTLTKQ